MLKAHLHEILCYLKIYFEIDICMIMETMGPNIETVSVLQLNLSLEVEDANQK